MTITQHDEQCGMDRPPLGLNWRFLVRRSTPCRVQHHVMVFGVAGLQCLKNANQRGVYAGLMVVT